MGQQQARNELFKAVETNNPPLAAQVLEKHPELMDAPLAGSQSATPLQRSAWRGDIDMIMFLIEVGADLDKGDHKGISPLMWAAKRDHVEVCIVLVKAGCHVTKRSLEGFSALDYAILNGNYASAYMLYEFDKNILSEQRYQKENEEKMLRYVDYEQFIKCLRDGIYIAKAPNMLEKPPKPQLRDPVYDRSETWGGMIKRIANFEPPPMVERSQSLQPSQILTYPA